MNQLINRYFLLVLLGFSGSTVWSQDDGSGKNDLPDFIREAYDNYGTADIYLYGITFKQGPDTTEIPVPGVTITMRDLYGEALRTTSNDTAHYLLELSFDNKYQIYFESEGNYTKFIELDTRDVVDIEKERGYLFPTDVSMEKSKSYEVAALLLKKPIGLAYFDRRSQTLHWDYNHTKKMLAEIEKLEKKAEKLEGKKIESTTGN